MADERPLQGQVIAPNTLSLADLAGRVDHEYKQLKDCAVRGAKHAVNIGNYLLQVKRQLGHGHWLEWFDTNCNFSRSAAQMYMKLAQNIHQISNSQDIGNLTLTAAIEMLEQLKEAPEAPFGTSKRLSKRTDKVGEAIKAAALSVLERAWDGASDNERNIFLKKIGAA